MLCTGYILCDELRAVFWCCVTMHCWIGSLADICIVRICLLYYSKLGNVICIVTFFSSFNTCLCEFCIILDCCSFVCLCGSFIVCLHPYETVWYRHNTTWYKNELFWQFFSLYGLGMQGEICHTPHLFLLWLITSLCLCIFTVVVHPKMKIC